jgi:hypothetical protein
MDIKIFLATTIAVVFILSFIYISWSFRSFFRYTFNDMAIIAFVVWAIFLLSGLIGIILLSGVL